MNNRFFHTGDLGDIIAAIPAIRALGGGELIIGNQRGHYQGRESMEGARFEAIKPLLEGQDNITSVAWGDDNGIDFDFSTFRNSGFVMHENLARWQARHLGVLVGYQPWLKVTARQETQGRAIFARSVRYHNRNFNWRRMFQTYRDPLFVGLESEKHAFEKEMGASIAYQPTGNLLELAQLIAGAQILVCNQSCPFWIAAALGSPVIQETCLGQVNSVIERPNAIYPVLPDDYRRLEY